MIARKVLYTFFLANLAIILLIWFTGSSYLLGDPTIINLSLAFGRLCGLLAVYLILIQFTLIGRVAYLERIFGLDKLSTLHHKVGKWGIFLIVTHPILISFSYAQSRGINIFEQELDFFLNYPDIAKAMLGLTLFIIVVITSLAIVRLKLSYETWYFVHLLTYVAVLLVFFHQLKFGGDFTNDLKVAYWYGLYIFFLGGFVVFRWIRPFYLFGRHKFKIAKIVPETDTATSIYISGKDLEKLPRQAGQFLILRFLDKKRWWQAHPFSLSTSSRNDYLRVTVKNSGDFTSEIRSIKVGTSVIVDGLYGIFVKRIATRKKILFLAGGIGITPIRALAEDMGADGYDMVLLYANTTESEIALKSELGAISRKYKLKIYYIISERDGHIDELKIRKFVKDVVEREVYLCGPVPFMDAMKTILMKIGIKEGLIHFEKFSLH